VDTYDDEVEEVTKSPVQKPILLTQELSKPPAHILPCPTAQKDVTRRSRSRDRQSEPQGLHVIYEPDCSPTVDIIFVHGLGGSSVSTWTKDRDEAKFWPKEFLPSEPGISNTRILSFGYTAFYLSRSSSSKLSITDFARSLLAAMKDESDLGLGRVRISTLSQCLLDWLTSKRFLSFSSLIQWED